MQALVQGKGSNDNSPTITNGFNAGISDSIFYSNKWGLKFGDDCTALTDCMQCALTGCSWNTGNTTCSGDAKLSFKLSQFFEQGNKCGDPQNLCAMTNETLRFNQTIDKKITKGYFCIAKDNQKANKNYFSILFNRTTEATQREIMLGYMNEKKNGGNIIYYANDEELEHKKNGYSKSIIVNKDVVSWGLVIINPIERLVSKSTAVIDLKIISTAKYLFYNPVTRVSSTYVFIGIILLVVLCCFGCKKSSQGHGGFTRQSGVDSKGEVYIPTENDI